jgi:hypothetical protein
MDIDVNEMSILPDKNLNGTRNRLREEHRKPVKILTNLRTKNVAKLTQKLPLSEDLAQTFAKYIDGSDVQIHARFHSLYYSAKLNVGGIADVIPQDLLFSE